MRFARVKSDGSHELALKEFTRSAEPGVAVPRRLFAESGKYRPWSQFSIIDDLIGDDKVFALPAITVTSCTTNSNIRLPSTQISKQRTCSTDNRIPPVVTNNKRSRDIWNTPIRPSHESLPTERTNLHGKSSEAFT